MRTRKRRYVSRRLFRLVSRDPAPDLTPIDPEAAFRLRALHTQEFLKRFSGNLPPHTGTILDYGCGLGATCIYLATAGAARVVGVDIDPERIAFARGQLAGTYSHLAGKVDFQVIQTPDEIRHEQFDLIISQDTFMYVDLARVVPALVDRLGPAGAIAIGLSPFWYSPKGGLIARVTPLPWAHLLFPEDVIRDERGIVFHDNRMTVRQFLAVMRATGLHERYLAFNVDPQRSSAVTRFALSAARRLPFEALRELTTVSAYGVWGRLPRSDSAIQA